MKPAKNSFVKLVLLLVITIHIEFHHTLLYGILLTLVCNAGSFQLLSLALITMQCVLKMFKKTIYKKKKNPRTVATMYKVSTQRGPCITLTLYTGFLVPYYYNDYYFNRVALSLACLFCNSGCHDFKSLGALCYWTGIQFADLINWYDVLME